MFNIYDQPYFYSQTDLKYIRNVMNRFNLKSVKIHNDKIDIISPVLGNIKDTSDQNVIQAMVILQDELQIDFESNTTSIIEHRYSHVPVIIFNDHLLVDDIKVDV